MDLRWLAAIDGALDALHAGIAVADARCGGGETVIALARAFPASRFTGFDIHGPNLARARDRAAQLGLAERCAFVQRDPANGLSVTFGMICLVDALDDSLDPRRVLGAARDALAPGGFALCVEPPTRALDLELLADDAGFARVSLLDVGKPTHAVVVLRP